MYFQNNSEKWMKQINQHAPSEVVKLLIGNKIDANEDEREVKTLEGKTLADRFEVPFIEVSAKTGQNISDAFSIITKQIIDKYLPTSTPEDNRMQLNNESAKKSKKGECQC